ncbi:MAG: HEAT repeat domain-containing protein [Clostridiales bacterium]|nr:HEAT repeat domain-containing protein [Clostridiales bacterium]
MDLFEREGIKLQFINALGVKGFYDASEYLIGEYKKNMPPNYNEPMLNAVSQTLARIGDLRYVDEYIAFLSDNVSFEAGYLVEMLGNMRVEKAVPTIIKLLNYVAIIPQNWYENILEDQKFYVSQCAIKALGKFNDSSLIPYLEKFLEPEKLDWIKFDCVDNNKYLKRIYREYKELATKAIAKLKK